MLRKAVYSTSEFENISNYYYSEIMKKNPIMASWVGEHSLDSFLPKIGAEAVEENIDFLKKMSSAFASLPSSNLTVDEQIDQNIMIHYVEQNLFLEEKLQRWKMGKDLAMNIGDSIFLLFARDFAPLTERVKSIICRLKAVPDYLMQGRTLFQNVPTLWGEIYLESARNLPSFIDTIEKSLAPHISPSLLDEYSKASTGAKKALGIFITWFKSAIMSNSISTWKMGEDSFNALLASKKLGLNQEEILSIGEYSIQKANEQLELLSQRILGIATGSAKGAKTEVQKRIRSKTPSTFDKALTAFKESVKQCRTFIENSGFATLPPADSLQIIETPHFMTHLIPFSAYIGPERASGDQKGIYLLTRDNNNSKYSYAEMLNNAIHEIYPGHHLQLTGHSLHPGKMRNFSDCIEISEGWGHYCEEATSESGLEVSDECLFARASDELFYSVRVLIDVKMQTGQWSFDNSLQFLTETCDIDRNSALSELKRYTQSPGTQLSNIVGKHIIKEIKSSLKNKFSDNLTDMDFHDLIIYEGTLPVHVAKEYYPKILTQNSVSHA